MFLMWLGEQITERGIGNGISMIIFAGIVAGLPGAIGGTLSSPQRRDVNPALALISSSWCWRGGDVPSWCSSSAASAASRSTTPSASRVAASYSPERRTCR
jgi:hypothetical protein